MGKAGKKKASAMQVAQAAEAQAAQCDYKTLAIIYVRTRNIVSKIGSIGYEDTAATTFASISEGLKPPPKAHISSVPVRFDQ